MADPRHQPPDGVDHQALVEALPALVWRSGPDGALEYLNAAWTAFTGWTLDKLQGHGWLDAVHQDDRRRVMELFRSSAGGGRPFELQFRLRRTAGDHRWMLCRAAPVTERSGVVRAYVGSCMDVQPDHELVQRAAAGQTAAETAQHLSEMARHAAEESQSRAEAIQRELDARATELARSNAELEQFAYVASHDLQEPLRMVASYVQLLARRYQGQLDADADKFIAYAVEGASRMQRLINDLLAFSRVGTQRHRHVVVALDQVVDQCLENLRTLIQETGGMVTRQPLPPVLADAQQIAQLFQNLVGNALKFRSDEPPQVRISAVRRDEWVELAVSDNGIGIEPQFFERIFIIFQRLHGPAKYPGTGIGLALCKKIVEQHGGKLWLDSTAGRGTTFRFTLPAAPRNAT